MTSTRVEDFKLEDWLPYWISPNDFLAFLAALAVLVAFLAIWQALRAPDPLPGAIRKSWRGAKACARRCCKPRRDGRGG